jgi:hypothetical protein
MGQYPGFFLAYVFSVLRAMMRDAMTVMTFFILTFWTQDYNLDHGDDDEETLPFWCISTPLQPLVELIVQLFSAINPTNIWKTALTIRKRA